MRNELIRNVALMAVIALGGMIALAALGHAWSLNRRVDRLMVALAPPPEPTAEAEAEAEAGVEGPADDAPPQAEDAPTTAVADAATTPTTSTATATSGTTRTETAEDDDAPATKLPAEVIEQLEQRGIDPAELPPDITPDQIREMLAQSGGGQPGNNDKPRDADALPEDLAELIEEKGLFGRPPNPGPPALTGILGEMAILNDQFVAVGASVGGAKLLEVHPAHVVIEFQGNRQELQLWDGATGSGGPSSSRGGPGEMQPGRRGRGGGPRDSSPFGGGFVAPPGMGEMPKEIHIPAHVQLPPGFEPPPGVTIIRD